MNKRQKKKRLQKSIMENLGLNDWGWKEYQRVKINFTLGLQRAISDRLIQTGTKKIEEGCEEIVSEAVSEFIEKHAKSSQYIYVMPEDINIP